MSQDHETYFNSDVDFFHYYCYNIVFINAYNLRSVSRVRLERARFTLHIGLYNILYIRVIYTLLFMQPIIYKPPMLFSNRSPRVHLNFLIATPSHQGFDDLK